MEYYPKIENFVVESFKRARRKELVNHQIRTAYWVKFLKADADEAFLIAAVAHDVERAFYGDTTKGSRSKERIERHEKLSAEVIGKHLQELGAENELIERVKMLISKHEEGGNDDQNLLKDADSISFFENNVPIFLNRIIKETGSENVKQKFEWMYERITSQKAKEIVKPMYEDSIKKLNKTIADGNFT